MQSMGNAKIFPTAPERNIVATSSYLSIFHVFLVFNKDKCVIHIRVTHHNVQ